MAEGLIFNIQKFCINDGPGIRTTVFFKGCPLRCKWCHNPESHRERPELLFSPDKCVLCGKCALVCKNGVHILDDGHIVQRENCTFCRECESVCPADALNVAGKKMTSDEIISVVLSDKEFFIDSGGGMTLSGGEPFLQYEFMLEILKKAKENSLHTCIETCGFTDREKMLSAAEFTDIFLFDIKLTDVSLHKKYTGAGNEKILGNLKALDERESKIILRCPIIPSVNDTSEHMKGIAQIGNSLKNVTGIEISPYHDLGISKLFRMGKTDKNRFITPEKEAAAGYISEVKKYTDIPVKRM